MHRDVHAAHHDPRPDRRADPGAALDEHGVAGVHVQYRQRETGLSERLLGAATTNKRIIASGDQNLAAPHFPTDLDDLAGVLDWMLERHAVPSLDHLGTGAPEPEVEAPLGQRVECDRGLSDECRRAGVDGDDPGHQLEGGPAHSHRQRWATRCHGS